MFLRQVYSLVAAGVHFLILAPLACVLTLFVAAANVFIAALRVLSVSQHGNQNVSTVTTTTQTRADTKFSLMLTKIQLLVQAVSQQMTSLLSLVTKKRNSSPRTEPNESRGPAAAATNNNNNNNNNNNTKSNRGHLPPSAAIPSIASSHSQLVASCRNYDDATMCDTCRDAFYHVDFPTVVVNEPAPLMAVGASVSSSSSSANHNNKPAPPFPQVMKYALSCPTSMAVQLFCQLHGIPFVERRCDALLSHGDAAMPLLEIVVPWRSKAKKRHQPQHELPSNNEPIQIINGQQVVSVTPSPISGLDSADLFDQIVNVVRPYAMSLASELRMMGEDGDQPEELDGERNGAQHGRTLSSSSSSCCCAMRERLQKLVTTDPLGNSSLSPLSHSDAQRALTVRRLFDRSTMPLISKILVGGIDTCCCAADSSESTTAAAAGAANNSGSNSEAESFSDIINCIKAAPPAALPAVSTNSITSSSTQPTTQSNVIDAPLLVHPGASFVLPSNCRLGMFGRRLVLDLLSRRHNEEPVRANVHCLAAHHESDSCSSPQEEETKTLKTLFSRATSALSASMSLLRVVFQLATTTSCTSKNNGHNKFAAIHLRLKEDLSLVERFIGAAAKPSSKKFLFENDVPTAVDCVVLSVCLVALHAENIPGLFDITVVTRDASGQQQHSNNNNKILTTPRITAFSEFVRKRSVVKYMKKTMEYFYPGLVVQNPEPRHAANSGGASGGGRNNNDHMNGDANNNDHHRKDKSSNGSSGGNSSKQTRFLETESQRRTRPSSTSSGSNQKNNSSQKNSDVIAELSDPETDVADSPIDEIIAEQEAMLQHGGGGGGGDDDDDHVADGKTDNAVLSPRTRSGFNSGVWSRVLHPFGDSPIFGEHWFQAPSAWKHTIQKQQFENECWTTAQKQQQREREEQHEVTQQSGKVEENDWSAAAGLGLSQSAEFVCTSPSRNSSFRY